MKRALQLCIISTCIALPPFAHGYPPGFVEFVYRGGASLSPFTNQMDNSQIMFETNCNSNGFPALDKSITCTPNGTLVVEEGAQTISKEEPETIEARLIGLFALPSKAHVFVKLDRPASAKRQGCSNPDILIMPVSNDNTDNTRVQTAVNALSFNHTLKFDIQGCVFGHPRIIDFKVLNCDSKECQDTLKFSLPRQLEIIP